MNPEERRELLRQRFKETCKLPFVFTGARRVKPVEPERSCEVYPRWQRCEGSNMERTAVWMKEPNAKRKPDLRTKHKQGVPVLTKLAGKAPKKLRRVFVNAEAYLNRD